MSKKKLHLLAFVALGLLFCFAFVVILKKFFFVCFGRAVQLAGILVPGPGIEPGPMAVKVPSPNRWTAREFPVIV